MTIDTTPFGHRHKWVRLWGNGDYYCSGGDNCYAEIPARDVEQRINAFPDLLEACEAALSMLISGPGAELVTTVRPMLSMAIAKAKGEPS